MSGGTIIPLVVMAAALAAGLIIILATYKGRVGVAASEAEPDDEDTYRHAAHKIILDMQTPSEVMMWALPQETIDKFWKLAKDATDPKWARAFSAIAKFYQKKRDREDAAQRVKETREARVKHLLETNPPLTAPPPPKAQG